MAEEALTPTQHFAKSVRRHRIANGWTQPELADECKQLGLDWDRSIIANVEAGRRASVTVHEVTVLGRVFRVPPILLLFPFDQVERVMLPKDVEVAAWDAVAWFTGRAPFPHWRDQSGGMVGEPDGLELFEKNAVPIDLWSEHERLLTQWRTKVHAGDLERRGAEKASTDDERSARLRSAEQADREAQSIVGALWDVRRRMRQHGIRTPELPERLRDVADRDPLAVAVERHYEKGGSE